MRRSLPLIVLALAACSGEEERPEGAHVERSALTGTWQTGANVGSGTR